jgi:hypothetical protein
MTYGVRTQGVLRVVRHGLARLNHLLLEAGSSDEDLVFHIRKSDPDSPVPDPRPPPSRPEGRRVEEPPFGRSP